MICQQGEHQGIGRIHQDPSGKVIFARPGVSHRAAWGPQGAPIWRKGSTAVDTWADSGFSDSFAPDGFYFRGPQSRPGRSMELPWGGWAISGQDWVGCHGRPVGDVRKLTNGVQSTVKIIDFFFDFEHWGHLGTLSPGQTPQERPSLASTLLKGRTFVDIFVPCKTPKQVNSRWDVRVGGRGDNRHCNWL